MDKERLIKLIQNLRRGEDVFKSKIIFFREIKLNSDKWLKTLDLRWLISIVDTFADHGTPIEKSNAMIISTFANLIKIADTAIQLTRPDETKLQRLLEDVVYLYDGMNSTKIIRDDMLGVLWFRISDVMEKTPILGRFFEEIKERFKKNSQILKISQYDPQFWEPDFFSKRKNFRNYKKC